MVSASSATACGSIARDRCARPCPGVPLFALVVLAALAAMPVAAQSPSPSPSPFDRPFSAPQYLIHATGHGTTSGGVKDDFYLLYTQEPNAKGDFTEPDGSGGTYGYSSDWHAGPFTTGRAVCAAAAGRGLPPQEWAPWNHDNEAFDCRLLAAGPASGSGVKPTVNPTGTFRLFPPDPHPIRTKILWVGAGIGVLVLIGLGGAWLAGAFAGGGATAVGGAAEVTAIEAAEGGGLLAASTVPEGLTWGSVAAERAAEAQRLVEAAGQGVRGMASLGHYGAQVARALRVLYEGGQLTAEQFQLLVNAGFLPPP